MFNPVTCKCDVCGLDFAGTPAGDFEQAYKNHYCRGPYVSGVKMGMSIEELKKALEAGGYNAAPAPKLTQGSYSMGYRIDPICSCGSKAGQFKLGHKPSCCWWVFNEISQEVTKVINKKYKYMGLKGTLDKLSSKLVLYLLR